MNIKSFNFNFICFFTNVFILINLLFLSSCSKQKNNKVAQNYYKMALIELQEQKTTKQYSYKKALDFIDKAIIQDEKSEYLALKGTILFELGYDVVGEYFFDSALLKARDLKLRAEILNNKACLLAQMGMICGEEAKIEQALDIWNKLENDKDYLTPEVVLFNKSKVFVFKNDYKKAKEYLEKAIFLAPNYLDAHYYLALVYYNLSDYESSKKELDIVSFLYPEHSGVKNLKKIIQNL